MKEVLVKEIKEMVLNQKGIFIVQENGGIVMINKEQIIKILDNE